MENKFLRMFSTFPEPGAMLCIRNAKESSDDNPSEATVHSVLLSVGSIGSLAKIPTYFSAT